MPNSFEHNYLIYDEFGEKEILCMSCGKKIKTRSEIQSKKFPGKIIREMSNHSDYREIPVKLSDGNLAFIMVCDDCKFVDINPDNCRRIDNQLRQALKRQMEWHGKTEEIISAVLEKNKRTVTGRAEPSDVALAMKGVI